MNGDSVVLELGGAAFEVPAAQWLTPLVTDEGEALLAQVPVGKGRAILCGTYLGDAYLHRGGVAFEDFLVALVAEAGVVRPAESFRRSPWAAISST